MTMPTSSAITQSTANGRSNKSDRSTRIVILKLSPKLLNRFSSTPIKGKKDQPKESASPSSSSADPAPPASSVDNGSDAASTLAAPTDGSRKKCIPGPKPGNKRTLNQIGEILPKPRGKPGPKKKPRLDDGTIDHKALAASHKLGPKANQGAINAGLRALDRSGAPCRKWEKKSFHLKSFTGVLWQVSTWRTPRPKKLEPDPEAREGAIETGDSDCKANHSGSIVPSEKSHSGDGDLTPLPTSIANSPAPAIAMAA